MVREQAKMRIMEQAEEQYKLTLASDPKHVNTHSNYGILLDELGRKEEAEEQYKLALASDPKHVNTHSNYGILLKQLGRKEEAEEQYKLALASDPKDVRTYYNYGNLLYELGRKEETEEQYKLALASDPKDVRTYSNYGILLDELGRKEEAEEQYKLALASDPKDVNTHYNYGILLDELGRKEEAEEQYKLALASDPKHVNTHSNYGILLDELDRNKEAEEQFKIAIKIDSKYPNIHGAYGLLLLKMNSKKKAIKETKIASCLYGEKGDKIKEHLALAWLYERLAGKYYKLKDYQKSGDYAKESGNEYIEAGKHVEERYKSTYWTKGYTLLGRAKIRKLEIKRSLFGRIIHRVTQNRVSYEVKTLIKIMDCVIDASECYKKAAEASPENDQICNACFTSMLCLSNMLDYMLAVVTKKKEITKLEDEIEKWENRLIVCRDVYKGNAKGESFIQSLYKLMDCIKNLEKYKNSRMRMDERAFEDCVRELLYPLKIRW